MQVAAIVRNLFLLVSIYGYIDVAPATQLTLELTPRSGPVAGMAVSYTVVPNHKSAEPLVLRLDTLEPKLVRDTDQVIGLKVTDQDGEVSLEAPRRDKAGDVTWQLWRSARPTRGKVTVAYFMPAAVPLPAKRGPHIDMQATGGGLSGSMSSVLVLPDLENNIALDLRWHVGEGERAVSTLGIGDTRIDTHLDDLRHALFAAGPLVTYPTPPPVNGFSMFALGETPDAVTAAARWSRRAYEAERRAFLAPADQPFRFLIRSYAGGPLESGTATKGSFLLYLPSALKPDTPSIHHLIAHEMVHTFNAELSGDPGSQGDWYTEGMADYFAVSIPAKAGLYPAEDLVDVVNVLAASYYTNPNREVTLRTASSIKWSAIGAWTIPYRRGALYFAILDAKLRAHGSRTRVLDLVNAMNERVKAGAPANDSTWLALLKARAGEWAVADWIAMRDGVLLRPAEGTFGACLVAVPLTTGFFDLGFSWKTTTSGLVVSEVEPGSSAAKAGLLPNDQILNELNTNPLAESFDKPVQLQINRGSDRHDIAFDPHGTARVDAYRWELRDGKGDAAAAGSCGP
jgi:predicted metalloprotease with PDZ domain